MQMRARLGSSFAPSRAASAAAANDWHVMGSLDDVGVAWTTLRIIRQAWQLRWFGPRCNDALLEVDHTAFTIVVDGKLAGPEERSVTLQNAHFSLTSEGGQSASQLTNDLVLPVAELGRVDIRLTEVNPAAFHLFGFFDDACCVQECF